MLSSGEKYADYDPVYRLYLASKRTLAHKD